eukprot:15356996-Ditylum_brightwellii.AAC.1
MEEQCNDAKVLAKLPDKKTGFFAKHFAKHFLIDDITNQELDASIEFDVITCSNPLLCMKTFKACPQ